MKKVLYQLQQPSLNQPVKGSLEQGSKVSPKTFLCFSLLIYLELSYNLVGFGCPLYTFSGSNFFSFSLNSSFTSSELSILPNGIDL